MQTKAIQARMTVIIIAGIISCLASAICVAQTPPAAAPGDLHTQYAADRVPPKYETK